MRNERGQEEVVVWCYDTTANKVQRLILTATDRILEGDWHSRSRNVGDMVLVVLVVVWEQQATIISS